MANPGTPTFEQLRTFLPKKLWREVMSEAPLVPRVASSDELGEG